MATSPAAIQPNPLEQKLVRATITAERRRLQLVDFGRRLRAGIAATAAGALLFVFGDHALRGGLPLWIMNVAGLLLTIALGIWACIAAVRSHRRMNEAFVARHVEQSRGVAHNVLLNMVLLDRDGEARFAEGLAAHQCAAELASPSGAVVAAPRLLRAWTGPLIVVGVWLLFAVATPKPVLPSLGRLLGFAIAAPSATVIERVSPQPGKPIYAGEPLTIEFELRGQAAGALEFELLAEPGGTRSASAAGVVLRQRVERTAGDRAADRRRVALAAHEVCGTLRFRATAGDAVLAETIPLSPLPALDSYEICLTPPAYLRLPPRVQRDGDIRAWIGTRADIAVRAQSGIQSPVLVFAGATETRTRMIVGSDGNSASLSMTVSESGRYSIEFSDRWGRLASGARPNRVVVDADQPPRIDYTVPKSIGASLDLTNTPWLRVVAVDDVGLSAVEFVVDREGVLTRMPLLNRQSNAAGEALDLGVATADLELKSGQSLRAWFEARDNRKDAQGKDSGQLSATRVVTLWRSAEPVVARTFRKREDAGAANGEPGGSGTAVGTRVRGEGEGGNATGDGAGDSPTNGAGNSGGTYRNDPSGKPAATGASDGGISDPGSVTGEPAQSDQQSGNPNADGASERGGGDGDFGQGDGKGKGDHSGGEPGADQADDARNNAERTFADDMKRFIEKHGEDAREASGAQDMPTGDETKARTSSPPKERASSPDSPNPDESGSETEPKAAPNENDAATTNQPAGADADSGSKEAKKPSEPTPPNSNPKDPSRADVPPNSKPANREHAHEEQPADEPRRPEPAQPKKSNEPDPPSNSDTPDAPPAKENSPSADGSKPATEPAAAKDKSSDALPSAPGDDSREADAGAIEMPGAKPETPMRAAPESSDDAPAWQRPMERADRGKERLPAPEAIDLLKLLERSSEETDEALRDLPWPDEKKAAFVRELERLRQSARRAGVLADPKKWRSRMLFGDPALGVGRALSDSISTGTSGAEMSADGMDKLTPATEQRVAPRLRPILDAYYRSLAERRTAGEARHATSQPGSN